MKTVFLFIPHYVYTSDLLHTNYIKYLAEKYRVVVLSPVFKLNSTAGYYQSPNVIYLPWDSPNQNLWLQFNKTWRWALVREFDRLAYHQLRDRTGINLNWQRSLLKTLGKLIPAPLVSADTFSKLESWLLKEPKEFARHLEKYKPDLILTSTPGFTGIEAEAILLAKKRGLKTVAVNFSWDNLFNNAKQIRKPDYLMAWNEPVKRSAHEVHHYPEDRVWVSGIMRFDHHFTKEFKTRDQSGREEFLKAKGLDPNLKTVLFTTVPPQTYPGQPDFLRRLIELRGLGVWKENFNILTRLHPRDDFKNYERFVGQKNVHIEDAGKLREQKPGDLHKVEMDGGDLENLRKTLLYSDLTVNFRSSLTLETCLYDLPTINLAYNNYAAYYQMDHYIPILESGAVRLVENEDQLIAAVSDYLQNRNLDSEFRKKIAWEYVPFQDGLSYKRNVDLLSKITG